MTAQKQAPPRLAYTLPEVAKALGISADTIRRAVRRGDIEAKVIGGVKLVPADVYDRLLEDAPSAAS